MKRFSTAVLSLLAFLAYGFQPAAADTSSAGPVPAAMAFDPDTGHFTDPPAPEGGWLALADILQKAAPSTNTALPLTPSEITDRLAAMIDAGKAQEALELIRQRESIRQSTAALGNDVQLEYQHARALAALGQHDQAMEKWRVMTIDYPELPEPWNALAIEQARRGQLQLARASLDMALASDPAFAPALENLGLVQMQLAREAFARARAARGHQSSQDATGNRTKPVPDKPLAPMTDRAFNPAAQ